MKTRSPQCIWMESGVLDYQLCSLDFDCDSCEIHHRISNPNPKSEETAIPTDKMIRITEFPPAGSFQPGFQYYQNYIWIKHVGQDLVVLGIDDIFLRIWKNISQVITKGVTSRLAENDSFAWLVMPEGLVNLKISFEGTVAEVNPLIRNEKFDFDDFMEHPFENRWLLKLQPNNGKLDRAKWLTKNQYISQQVEDTKAFHFFLNNENDRNKAMGKLTKDDSIEVSYSNLKILIDRISKGTHQLH